MTEQDLMRDVVSAAIVAYIAGGELGPIQPAVDAVLAVFRRADVRVTLPYRLTPPVKDGGWRILED